MSGLFESYFRVIRVKSGYVTSVLGCGRIVIGRISIRVGSRVEVLCPNRVSLIDLELGFCT